MSHPHRLGRPALAWLGPVCAAAALLLSAAAPAAERPNVIVFLADDQGWGDLTVSGNTQLQTPHINSLASGGATLDRFYVCPVCSPTRAEFLTGRYHLRGGVRGVSTGQERLDLNEATIAQAFQAAGYATAAFGKWHNGSQWPYHPNARGFDEYYGFTSGHWGEYFDAPLEHNGQPVRGRGYVTDDFTQRGLQFIRQHRQQPFFCYFAYNTPHSPFIVPQEYWQRFRDKPITQRGPDGERETVDVTRAALAMCENIDWNVGRVLALLDELELSGDTIVVYFSDNGPNSFRWNGGMKGRKGSTDEGGVRSACFMRWPGKIPAGSTVGLITAAIDLLPTLTSLAGISRVGDLPLDGADLSRLLLGQEADWPPRKIFSHWAGRISVRTQQYRLDASGGLFDMQADPGQQTDLRAQRPEVAAELAAAVADWRREMGGGDLQPSVEPAAEAPPKPEAVGKAKAKPKEKPKPKPKPPLAVLPPDDRPFPVGYAAFPRTPLPARDGRAQGGVKRSASAPNCSYFVDWRSPDDRITWDVQVMTPGRYHVEILYAVPEADAGARIELSFGDSRLEGRVTPGWDPPLITDQDVIPRPPAESIMKDFRPLALGTIRLEAGRGPLTLRALEIPGREVMQVRSLTLTMRQP